jgi:hypothetical protein
VDLFRDSKRLGSREYQDNLCFVILPFRDKFDTLFEVVLKPLIEKRLKVAGQEFRMTCLRSRDIFENRPVLETIWDGIQRARVVIAELSTQNANVLYELGLRHAINRPVILVASDIGQVPFDLQSLPVVLYSKEYFEQDEFDRIREQIGRELRERLRDILRRDVSQNIHDCAARLTRELKNAKRASDLWARAERLGIRDVAGRTGDTIGKTLDEADREFDFMGVSAQFVVSNPAFERRLGAVKNRDIHCRLLLLKPDPNSEAVKKHAAREGRQASDIVRHTLTSLGDLREFEQREGVTMEVRLYEELPKFRMVFVDRGTLYLSFYLSGERTAFELPQLIIHKPRPGQRTAFEAFENYWNERWDTAIPYEPDRDAS